MASVCVRCGRVVRFQPDRASDGAPGGWYDRDAREPFECAATGEAHEVDSTEETELMSRGVTQTEEGTVARCECGWSVTIPAPADGWAGLPYPDDRIRFQKKDLLAARAAFDQHQCREHAEQLRELASDQLVEPVWLHPMNGSGAWPAAGPRRQRWYDLDAATAAALMVLAPVVAAVGGVVVFVARRFRVVRR